MQDKKVFGFMYMFEIGLFFITQVSEKTHGFNHIVGQDMSEQLKITLVESV